MESRPDIRRHTRGWERGGVPNEWRLKGGINALVMTLKKKHRYDLYNGRESLQAINQQLEPDRLRIILGDNLCQQVTVLVDSVHRSCAQLSTIFKYLETAELVLVVEEQIQMCLSVLRAIAKVIAGKSSDAEEIVFNVTQWVNDTQPFRESNDVYADKATDRLRRKITLRSDAIAYRGPVILAALLNVLDEVDPSTKHERTLARIDRERARISPSEDDREARQERIEELEQERAHRLQEIQTYIAELPPREIVFLA